MLDPLILFLGQFTYFSAIIILVSGSFGLPIPEEAVLLALGYLAAAGLISCWGAMLAALCGIILGDSCAYFLARKFGWRRLEKCWHKLFLPAARIEKLEQHWQRHQNKTVFLSRFMLGLRFIGPLTAGIGRMSYGRFLLLDLLSIFIWVPLMVLVGYFFSLHLDNILRDLHFLKHWIFLGLLVVLIAASGRWLYYYLFKSPQD